MTPETLSAIAVFGGLALILPTFFLMLSRAPGPLSATGQKALLAIPVVVLLWLGIAVATSLSAGLSFPIFLPFALVPIAVGFALSFHPGVAEVLARVPTHWLIFLSVYRNIGFVFLAVYWTGGDISWGFARNAGWGDVLTGVLAVPVGWMIWKNIKGQEAALLIWSVIGIGDLILAPASAQMFGGGETLTSFPLNLIPLFLGPPFGILLHILTLRAFYLKQRMQRAAPA
ncbi:MAG: hypothetical protein AAF367_12730 [Pseudomonadota bacterium]